MEAEIKKKWKFLTAKKRFKKWFISQDVKIKDKISIAVKSVKFVSHDDIKLLSLKLFYVTTAWRKLLISCGGELFKIASCFSDFSFQICKTSRMNNLLQSKHAIFVACFKTAKNS